MINLLKYEWINILNSDENVLYIKQINCEKNHLHLDIMITYLFFIQTGLLWKEKKNDIISVFNIVIVI